MINHLKGIFDEHGIPERFISDNGTQYSSEEFKQFADTYGFEHVTSSPLYPRSNGFAERMVQTVKHLFTKARESGQDPHMAMLCLRTTPIDHQLPSPSEILNGRKYRSNMPITGKSPTSYTGHLQQRQNLHKAFHNRRMKDLPPLQAQQQVRVQDPHNHQWVPDEVTEVLKQPRSYKVKTTAGTYRRNRQHLRQTRESFNISDEVSDLSDDDSAAATEPAETTTTPVDENTPMPLRRSSRPRKPPDRLDL